jgi:hypothetical protein
MKTLGIYFHESMGTSMILEDHFKALGISLTNYDCCLCEINGNTKIKEDVIILHPGDHEECWEEAKRVILNNQSTDFYIITLAKPRRETGIGFSKNVKYLSTGDAISSFRKSIESILL